MIPLLAGCNCKEIRRFILVLGRYVRAPEVFGIAVGVVGGRAGVRPRRIHGQPAHGPLREALIR